MIQVQTKSPPQQPEPEAQHRRHKNEHDIGSSSVPSTIDESLAQTAAGQTSGEHQQQAQNEGRQIKQPTSFVHFVTVWPPDQLVLRSFRTAHVRLHPLRQPGRRPSLTLDQAELAQKLYDAREHTVQQIADILRVRRSTLYGHPGPASGAFTPGAGAFTHKRTNTRFTATGLVLYSDTGRGRTQDRFLDPLDL